MNKRISLSLILIMIIATLSFSSCGSTRVTYPEGVETYTYTDDYGREVELRKDISKIVASGPNAQMILVTLAPEMMVGLAEAPSMDKAKYFPDYYIDMPTLGQFYGKKMSLNLENLMQTDTEIIIDVGEIQEEGNEDMDTIQKETGIATIYVEADLDTYPEAYRKLGKILGKEKEAEKLAVYCEDTIAMAKKIKSKLTDKDIQSILFGVNSTGLNCNVEGSIQAAVIDFIGAKNAVHIDDEDEVSGRDGGNPMNLEQIYKLDPDVVIIADGGPYERMKDKDSQWKELNAVKNDKYYEVPCDPYSWMSAPPSVNQVLGARWLMSVVYPKLYDGDIYQDAKEYYKLFWHYDLTDKELNSFLKNSAAKVK